MAKDPWEDRLADVKGIITPTCDGGEERITTREILGMHLQLTPDRQTDVAAKRVRAVMNKLGWQGPKKMKIPADGKEAGTALWGYWRAAKNKSVTEVPSVP
jgi:hypothetical protein